MNPKRRGISDRWIFLLVAILTLVLLIGSTLLQRIILHAAQVNSSVYLTEPGAAVLPGSNVNYTIEANLNGNAVVGGAQFVITYNPQYLQLTSEEPVAPWRSRRVLSQTSGSQ